MAQTEVGGLVKEPGLESLAKTSNLQDNRTIGVSRNPVGEGDRLLSLCTIPMELNSLIAQQTPPSQTPVIMEPRIVLIVAWGSGFTALL